MGSGIAHLFALHGYEVRLVDVHAEALERARDSIAANMERQVRKEVISAADRAAALERIERSTELASVDAADMVIEAASENRDLKFQLIREIDEIAPRHAILATNTSSISITEIGARTSRAEQVIGMHFMNPVPVMRLVELVRGLATSDETARVTADVAESLDKTVAEANDFPGFVSNRVLMPMINEAIYCLMEGVADVESIDRVMKLGMNHPMGPLALADLIGLDTCLAIMEVLHSGLGDDKYRPCPLLRKYVAAGRLGRKSGEGFHHY